MRIHFFQHTNQFAYIIGNRIKSPAISAVQKTNGKVRLLKYESNELITPLVNDIIVRIAHKEPDEKRKISYRCR